MSAYVGSALQEQDHQEIADARLQTAKTRSILAGAVEHRLHSALCLARLKGDALGAERLKRAWDLATERAEQAENEWLDAAMGRKS